MSQAARPIRLVFLGPPGAGKGTQAKVLEERYGAVHISTGDILRKNVAAGTKLGALAKPHMEAGGLVPDDLIVGMMEDALASHDAFILDGFPRTVAQAVALDEALARLHKPLTAVLLFEADRKTLVERLTGRWSNPRSGRVYHVVFNPPNVPGIDDEDLGPLVQRKDDTLEVVENRLATYDRETSPLIDYYAERGSLVRIDGLQAIDAVSEAVVRAIEARNGAPV